MGKKEYKEEGRRGREGWRYLRRADPQALCCIEVEWDKSLHQMRTRERKILVKVCESKCWCSLSSSFLCCMERGEQRVSSNCLLFCSNLFLPLHVCCYSDQQVNIGRSRRKCLVCHRPRLCATQITPYFSFFYAHFMSHSIHW